MFSFIVPGRTSNYDQIRDEDVKDNLAFDEEIKDKHTTSMNNTNTDDGAKENPGSVAVPKDARATGHYEEVNGRQSKKNSRVDSNYDDIRDSNYETIDEDVRKRVVITLIMTMTTMMTT